MDHDLGIEFANMELHAEMVRRWQLTRADGWSDAQIEAMVWGMIGRVLAVHPEFLESAVTLVRNLRIDATAS